MARTTLKAAAGLDNDNSNSPGQIDYLVFDVSYLAHRNHHAMERFATKDGRHSGHIYGSFKQVKAITWMLKPKTLVFVYDRGAPWRQQLLPDYKANRRLGGAAVVTVPNLNVAEAGFNYDPDDWTPAPDVERLFRTYPGIHLAAPGMEADDMAAWFASQMPISERRGCIAFLTADRDYWQLVSDEENIMCVNTKKGQGVKKTIINWTWPEDVQQEFGVPPKYLARLKAVLGDVSDNIRGLEGGRRPGKKDALRAFIQSAEGDRYFGNEAAPQKAVKTTAAPWDDDQDGPPLSSAPSWLQEELRAQRPRMLKNLQVVDLVNTDHQSRIIAAGMKDLDKLLTPTPARLGDCLGVLVEFECDSLLSQVEEFFKSLTRTREVGMAAPYG